MNCKFAKVYLSLFFALFLLLAQMPARAAEPDPRMSGPRSLIVAYHTAPANREKLRSYMLGAGLKDFAQWKREGAIADYHVYFNRYIDSDNWDMLAVVTLAAENGTARWAQIESAHPSGLNAAALALTTAIHTTVADLMRNKSKPAKNGKPPVYLMIPYDYLVSVNEYIKYVDAYVLAQTDGWIEEGVLSGYGFYLSRYAAGRPWSAMFVYEYASEDGLGARDVTVAKVRERLKQNSEWKAIADNKQGVRKELQPVVADELIAR
ncbi:MAG: hypothetical protein J0I77_10250 [Rudaea sp.]|uniref:hypothetical protein n=1 Tax=unclassified Rudaea TaxID=2627037 RepID=UPI0010F71AE7|nr:MULTISPECIES: hypothetical protein [unclassified Rudaea]MBN8886091.1 hypothetical protein [Rudaea sp.]MBR0346477.1 hypothetical protein [Rudaea sp.]